MENVDYLPPSAPNLVFERDTCIPYTLSLTSSLAVKISLWNGANPRSKDISMGYE